MTAESPKKSKTRRAAGGDAGGQAQAGRLRIEYYRSAIATPEKHKRVVKGLGFTRLRQVVEREDTPSIRGMVARAPHLVRILEN